MPLFCYYFVTQKARDNKTNRYICRCIKTGIGYGEDFLFSCLCGLRVSDIRKLKWSDLQQSGGRVRIEIKMQKTKEPLYLPISDEALKWLPGRGEAKDGDFIYPLTHEGTVTTRCNIGQRLLKSPNILFPFS